MFQKKKIVQDFSVHETRKFMKLGRLFLRYAKFEKLNILKLIHRDKDQMNIFFKSNLELHHLLNKPCNTTKWSDYVS